MDEPKQDSTQARLTLCETTNFIAEKVREALDDTGYPRLKESLAFSSWYDSVFNKTYPGGARQKIWQLAEILIAVNQFVQTRNITPEAFKQEPRFPVAGKDYIDPVVPTLLTALHIFACIPPDVEIYSQDWPSKVQWPLPNAGKKAYQIARELGCTDNFDTRIRQLTVEQIIQASLSRQLDLAKLRSLPTP